MGWYPLTSLLLLSLNICFRSRMLDVGWCSVCHITATPLATLISAEKDVKGPLNFVHWFLSTNHMGYWAHPWACHGHICNKVKRQQCFAMAEAVQTGLNRRWSWVGCCCLSSVLCVPQKLRIPTSLLEPASKMDKGVSWQTCNRGREKGTEKYVQDICL